MTVATFSPVHLRPRPGIGVGAVFCLLGFLADASRADIVIVANRTTARIELELSTKGEGTHRIRIEPREILPFDVVGAIQLRFAGASGEKHYELEAGSIYYFGRDERGMLGLGQIGLPSAEGAKPKVEKIAGGIDVERLKEIGVIRIKILVDDDEVALRHLWEVRLRRRVKAASKILARACRLRLEVVAVDSWESDDSINDFQRSLLEFEATVDPNPAHLAIGFTSQYPLVRSRNRRQRVMLGGTRGPLHPYILIREQGPGTNENERLEVLLHEVGHYLGAVHSPEPNSVMRPQLSDGKVNARAFRIAYDPVNSLAINLFSEEWRFRGVRQVRQLSPPTRRDLERVYTLLNQALPKDAAARRYRQMMAAPQETLAFKYGAEVVARAVLAAAEENNRLPTRPKPGQRTRLQGDVLTSHYFRSAAGAADRLPQDAAAEAFLFGLGLALDCSGLVRLVPQVAIHLSQTENASRKAKRLSTIGRPTVHGRADLLQHFVITAVTTQTAGATAAEAAGLLKELSDARRGSGFSFADVAANLAGIRFAEAVSEGKVKLTDVSSDFAVGRFVPAIEDLEEGLSAEKFQQKYGTIYDPRCRDAIAEIRSCIDRLPPYR